MYFNSFFVNFIVCIYIYSMDPTFAYLMIIRYAKVGSIDHVTWRAFMVKRLKVKVDK